MIDYPDETWGSKVARENRVQMQNEKRMNQDKPKLCKDCLCFQSRGNGWNTSDYCIHPNLGTNLAYGGPIWKHWTEVRCDESKCGPDGKWFMAKPPEPPKKSLFQRLFR